jgi:indolepyruvate ferredoxin oxidoreductase alpha subunit
VLCPSFYGRGSSATDGWDRFLARVRATVIGALQRRDARRRARFAF